MRDMIAAHVGGYEPQISKNCDWNFPNGLLGVSFKDEARADVV